MPSLLLDPPGELSALFGVERARWRAGTANNILFILFCYYLLVVMVLLASRYCKKNILFISFCYYLLVIMDTGKPALDIMLLYIIVADSFLSESVECEHKI